MKLLVNDKAWLDFDDATYFKMFNHRFETHEWFYDWYKDKNIESALEIGGGKCQHKDNFKDYHCVEINANMKADYITNCDFLDYKDKKKYDLVFSHAVIDHVPKPNEFIVKSIKMAKKYVFHSIYRGLQRSGPNHLEPMVDKNGYIYNQLSEFEIKRLVGKYNYKLVKLPNNNVCLIIKL